MAELSPLMKQYFSIKEEYPDAILFFRLGDFYEMFGDDAVTASSILQITLTTRDRGKDNPIPMCGIPHFSAETYISKLINAGYRVAICEQTEDPKEAKGIVKREVTKVVTPGTHQPDNPKENIFILSLYPSGRHQGISVADLSTGEFFLYETGKDIADEINRFEPREVLCPSGIQDDIHYSTALDGYFVTYYDDWLFDYSESYRKLLEYFKVYSLEAFGCEELKHAISAAGALLNYLEENSKGAVILNHPTVLNQGDYMFLDSVTKRNLELTHNLRDGTSRGTLLEIMDETLTPMGGRFLRQAIFKPLVNEERIRERLDAVEDLIKDYEMQEGLRTYLGRIQDIERLGTRVLQGSASPRDLVAIRNSIAYIPEIKRILRKTESALIERISGEIDKFQDLKTLIEESIQDDPPATLRDGGIIRSGYRQSVDELREISTEGKGYIAGLESRERQRTGISSLKIGYNRVFGYYIEVTKSNLHLVPENYIRKQTLVGAERFITEELKEYENRVLGAQERLKSLEYEVFIEVLERVAHSTGDLLKTARAIGALDFLLSLATVSRRNNYVKPAVDDTGRIEIIDGRHPVLEKISRDERFIPNSTYVDSDDHKLLIITGPNMAGKSTYMRQVALIVLLSQIGSFVPATQAKIGCADRIFTRIGASDYLSEGQSTFMVEMIETSNILHNATDRSLIILDEVGRGTSTFDGISIAWAVAEYIANKISARTLFATHYNELTELGLTMNGVKNHNIAVKEWGDEIIFLRKIERGPADKSYGIQVARLAGLPDPVIKRAKEVLGNLESYEITEFGTPRVAGRKSRKKIQQLDLFSLNYEPLISIIRDVDLDAIGSEDALKVIADLKKMIEDL